MDYTMPHEYPDEPREIAGQAPQRDWLDHLGRVMPLVFLGVLLAGYCDRVNTKATMSRMQTEIDALKEKVRVHDVRGK